MLPRADFHVKMLLFVGKDIPIAEMKKSANRCSSDSKGGQDIGGPQPIEVAAFGIFLAVENHETLLKLEHYNLWIRSQP
jgi:hypothetical protein